MVPNRQARVNHAMDIVSLIILDHPREACIEGPYFLARDKINLIECYGTLPVIRVVHVELVRIGDEEIM